MRAIKFFIFGILAALGAIAIELILSALFSILFNVDIEKNYSEKITFFLFLVVLTEEIFKLSLLWKLFSSSNKLYPKTILALFFGGGFAFFEIFSKIISSPQYNLLSILSLDFLGVFFIHTIIAGITSCFFGEKNTSAPRLIINVLLLASFLHLIYNLLIIYEQHIIVIYIYLFSISGLLYVLKDLQNKKKSTIINAG